MNIVPEPFRTFIGGSDRWRSSTDPSVHQFGEFFSVGKERSRSSSARGVDEGRRPLIHHAKNCPERKEEWALSPRLLKARRREAVSRVGPATPKLRWSLWGKSWSTATPPLSPPSTPAHIRPTARSHFEPTSSSLPHGPCLARDAGALD